MVHCKSIVMHLPSLAYNANWVWPIQYCYKHITMHNLHDAVRHICYAICHGWEDRHYYTQCRANATRFHDKLRQWYLKLPKHIFKHTQQNVVIECLLQNKNAIHVVFFYVGQTTNILEVDDMTIGVLRPSSTMLLSVWKEIVSAAIESIFKLLRLVSAKQWPAIHITLPPKIYLVVLCRSSYK